jgi:pyruvate dehydrogenase E2 component (dihydrolipoamide acetyltransferase)
VVPVIRDADHKGVIAIAKEMGDLAKLARDGKLKPDQMQGGTFTISSLGGIGGTYFTPIINAPEVAIMGTCRSFRKPVWDDKQFVPRLFQPLSLSWDHRVIDGAAAARFNAAPIALSRIAQLDQRTALPDQCLHSAEADVRPPWRKSGFDRCCRKSPKLLCD